MIISWWSAGVTSAVATKLAIDIYGKGNVFPVYFHIDTAHTDNKRFKEDCEKWYDKEIEVVTSDKYNDQFDVILKDKYINGPSGARCTLVLKKRLRQKIEDERIYDGQVFGFEYSKKEVNRAIRFKEQYPAAKPLFPLIEKKITKPNALHFLQAAGIKMPKMYELGYSNNNCIGCVKGGKGYWNKIRKDFPETFQRMSDVEQILGRSCINGTFLKDLDHEAGNMQKEITPDCGNFCDIEFGDLPHKSLQKVYENPEQLQLI